MNRRLFLAACAAALTPLLLATLSDAAEKSKPAKANIMMVYIGNYTSGDDGAIHMLRLNVDSGALTEVGKARGADKPSFLAIHPSRKFLYAVSEITSTDNRKTGAVAAMSIDPKTGHLTEINRQSSGGAGPCHLVVDHSGKNVLVANYGGGSVACLPIDPQGRLGPASAFVQHEGSSVNPNRQQGPHAHSIHVDAANRFAFAADLGLDKVLVYRFDAARGSLSPNDPASVSVPAGGGPRHFAFHPNGRFAFVNNEITSSVNALAYDAEQGELTLLQTLSTLPEGFDGKNNSTAEVQTHPNGKFLYVSNRGHDSIAAYAIDTKTGKLRFIAHQSTLGETPRNFGIDPTGRWLIAANQKSNNLVLFSIDAESGRLTPTGVQIESPSPVCVKFLPLE